MVIDSYDSPEAEALLQAGKQGGRAREVVTEVTAATGFLVAAGLLAGLAPWHRTQPWAVVATRGAPMVG